MSSSFDYINKINSLLAMANDESLTERARANYMAKAESLRATHKIDEAALRATGEASSDRIRFEEMAASFLPEFYGDIDRLVFAISRHCNLRVRIVYGGNKRKYELFGYGSDIEFFEILWTNAYLEFTGSLIPTWDAKATFDSNVYRFVKAGYRWADIHAAGRAADPGRVAETLTGRFKAAYVREAARLGEAAGNHTQRHGAFRASYAQAFAATVDGRLYEMRRKAKGDEGESGGYALALRSTDQEVDEAFYRMYPQYDPTVMAKRQAEMGEAERIRRAAMTEEERNKEDADKEARYAKARQASEKIWAKSYDNTGWQQGTAAGGRVDLSGGKNNLSQKRTEIS
jgi:hypothetical protein